ncbi:Conserved_hypothetical protein [Hexamita inflata]|uniref:Uncharacterized protein n=1 Tax=Hexamita inflata TaxID=28002 RepID=A0AA86PCD3_9EUKA|nr:Conserved hypothetical protein [Hexamita inflata]
MGSSPQEVPEIRHHEPRVLPLHVFRPFSRLNLFLSFESNRINVLNQHFKVIRSHVIDFDFYPGFKSPDYCFNRDAIFPYPLYSPVILNGQIYIQYFNKVCQLINSQLIMQYTIPNLRLDHHSSFYGRLFPFKNALFAHNNCDQLFELQNGEFKLVLNVSGQFFHSCGVVLVFDYNDAISVFNEDFTKTEIINVTGAKFVSYCNEYLIAHNWSGENAWVVRFNDLKAKICKNLQKLRIDLIGEELELGKNGLQLNEKMAREIFKKDYTDDNVYQQYIDKQLVYQEYKNEINNIIGFEILLDANKEHFERKSTTFEDTHEVTQQFIINKKNVLNLSIQDIAERINIIQTKFIANIQFETVNIQ